MLSILACAILPMPALCSLAYQKVFSRSPFIKCEVGIKKSTSSTSLKEYPAIFFNIGLLHTSIVCRWLLRDAAYWGAPDATLDATLKAAYKDFKQFCSGRRIHCSQPAFTPGLVPLICINFGLGFNINTYCASTSLRSYIYMSHILDS